VAPEGRAFGRYRIFVDIGLGHGIGHGAIRPILTMVFVDALHGGVVANLHQALGRGEPEKTPLKPALGSDAGSRDQENRNR
jgi:hypothetical protein